MNKLQLNILQISFPPTNNSYSIVMYLARDRGQCLLDKRCCINTSKISCILLLRSFLCRQTFLEKNAQFRWIINHGI